MRAYLGIIEAASIVALLLGLFMLGHHFGAKGVQAKWDHATIETQKATAVAEAKSRATEQAYSTQLAKAQNDHTQSVQRLQTAVAVAAATSSGLRNDLAKLRRDLPSLAADTVRQRADTLAAVLDQCQQNYRTMAANADAHALDVKLLQDAWPKQKE